MTNENCQSKSESGHESGRLVVHIVLVLALLSGLYLYFRADPSTLSPSETLRHVEPVQHPIKQTANREVFVERIESTPKNPIPRASPTHIGTIQLTDLDRYPFTLLEDEPQRKADYRQAFESKIQFLKKVIGLSSEQVQKMQNTLLETYLLINIHNEFNYPENPNFYTQVAQLNVRKAQEFSQLESILTPSQIIKFRSLHYALTPPIRYQE